MNQVAVIPQEAPGALLFPDGAGEFHGSFTVNGGDPSGVGGQDHPFFIELDGEIAGFIGKFRGELPDLVRLAGNPSLQDKILGFGEDTAVILQNGEGEIGIVGEVLPADHRHGSHDDRQYNEERQHGHCHQPDAQAPDHAISSRQ